MRYLHYTYCMKPLTFSILRLLSDGEFHSGVTIARSLEVSRAGVSNALRGLDAFGRPRLGGIGERLAPVIEQRTGIETRAVEPVEQLLSKGETSKEIYLLSRLQEDDAAATDR
ncbi:MAG: HTH domain-containing protein, partial [Nitrosospira sp.]|nr:HTH domain-containing protein [Nitrosospira sp.]